jgi:ERCC4-type nuclease
MAAPITRPYMDVAYEVGSREFLRPLIRLGVPARLRALSSGDMAFYGAGPHGLARVGIERKTVAEMVGVESRQRYISRQLPKMLSRYHFVFLVVEGLTKVEKQDGSLLVGKDVKQGKLTCWFPAGFGNVASLFTSYQKQELSLRLLTTVHVVRTANMDETAWFLHALYEWFQKPWASHHSVLGIETDLARDGVRNELIVSDRTMRRSTFAGWPGISWARSKRVSNYFTSVKQAVNASEQEWMQALGVKKGTVTARRIMRFLEGEEVEQKA